MLKHRSIVAALIAFSFAQAHAAASQLSFEAPPGWQLRADAARERYYWLAPARNPQRRCSIRLGAEAVQAPEDSQSAKSVRFREVFSGPGEPIIQRSVLRSKHGARILKANVRWNLFERSPTGFGSFHSVVYSFRGSDGRVYTLEGYPPVRDGNFFDAAMDEIARSIRP